MLQSAISEKKLTVIRAAAAPKGETKYRPRGSAEQLFYAKDPQVLMDGPADTGKSRACLEKLYLICSLVPGARAFIARKTRKSITQTAMVTFEKKVLPNGSRVSFHSTKQAYIFPNNSEIVIIGLDDPIKVQSGEYDIGYIQEATEVSENDWEMVGKLLRNGVTPYQQLMADCNPGPAHHWLNQRCIKGKTRRIKCRHEDNPSITEARLELLRNLTGTRRKRLYEGIWASSDHQIYDNWNRDIHVINRFAVPASWRKVISIDFGFTNAGVVQVWAFDGDGRAYLVHEVYRVQKKFVSWWLPKIKTLYESWGVDTIFPDPSEPEYIQNIRDAGLNVGETKNDVLPRIAHIHDRLDVAADGRARFYVFADALEERDPVLDYNARPCGFLEEVDAYERRVDKDGRVHEEPADGQDDHSLDCAGYALFSTARPGQVDITEVPVNDDDEYTPIN